MFGLEFEFRLVVTLLKEHDIRHVLEVEIPFHIKGKSLRSGLLIRGADTLILFDFDVVEDIGSSDWEVVEIKGEVFHLHLALSSREMENIISNSRRLANFYSFSWHRYFCYIHFLIKKCFANVLIFNTHL